MRARWSPLGKPVFQGFSPDEPWADQLAHLAIGLDERLGGGIGEAHLALRSDNHHPVGERVEDRGEAVALRRKGAECLAERNPHRLERPPQVGDLVTAAKPLEWLVELALGDAARAAGEPLHPYGDRRRDEEPDDNRDDHSDDRGGKAVTADRVDRPRQGLRLIRMDEQRSPQVAITEDRSGDHRRPVGQPVNGTRPLQRILDDREVVVDIVRHDPPREPRGDQLAVAVVDPRRESGIRDAGKCGRRLLGHAAADPVGKAHGAPHRDVRGALAGRLVARPGEEQIGETRRY